MAHYLVTLHVSACAAAAKNCRSLEPHIQVSSRAYGIEQLSYDPTHIIISHMHILTPVSLCVFKCGHHAW